MDKNNRVMFLNPDVEKEVCANQSLYVIWRLTYGNYDWEIDPLHNKDYVERSKQQEANYLDVLKRKISEYESELQLRMKH